MTKIETFPAQIGRGPGYRANIGLIALESDLVVECDVNHFSQLEGVAIFCNRIPVPDHTDHNALVSMLPHISRVCRGLEPLGRIDAVIYGCTAGSVAMGHEPIASAVHEVFPEAPCITPITAVLEALRALDCQSVDLLTPYAEDVTADMISFLQSNGIRVERCLAFGLRSGLEMGMIEPDFIEQATQQLSDGTADALFISCTALNVAPVYEAISAKQGRPVVTSNQALSWHALRLAGVTAKIHNLGTWLIDQPVAAAERIRAQL